MIVAKNCYFWSVFPQISCGGYPQNLSKFPKPHFLLTCTYFGGRRHGRSLPMAKATDGLAFGVTRHCRIEGLPPMPPTPAIWRRRSKVKRCMFQYKQSNSGVRTGNVQVAGHCGQQFRVRDGVVVRAFTHACPSCGTKVRSAKASGRLRIKHRKPNGKPCPTTVWVGKWKMDGRGESFCLGHDPSCLKAMCEQVLYYRQVTARWERMRNSRAPARFRPNWVAVWSAEPISFRHLRTRWKHGGIGAGQPMRNSTAPAGCRLNVWPFGLQSRSRLGTFEPAKSMESGEVLALGNPCETAKPHSRISAQGVAVWSAAPISFRHLRTR